MIIIYKENIVSLKKTIQSSKEKLELCDKNQLETYRNEGNSAYIEANKIVKLIEISPNYTNESKIEVKDLKKSINQLKDEMERVYNERITQVKQSLTLNLHDNHDIFSESDGKKYDQNEVEAYRQFSLLENSKKSILNIEGRSNDVQRELHSQSETMMKVSNNVGLMNMEIDDSDSIVKRMIKRENKNKIALVSIVVGVFILFLLILFFRMSGSSKINENEQKNENISLISKSILVGDGKSKNDQ